MIGITLTVLFITFMFIFWKKGKNLPPGPPRIPILGSVPFISTKRGLVDWVLDKSVTRHKVATVGLGSKNIFVINDFELAKDLFSKEEFSGRGISEFFLLHKGFDGMPYGIIMTEGSHWNRERRFGLKTLKGLGFGKQSLEEKINIEVEEIISNFLSKNEDFLLSNNFNVPIINILWQIVAGSRFTPDDPEGMEMLASVNRQFEIVFNMDVFPLKIMKMFPKATNYEEMANILATQKRFILKQIEEHEHTLDSEHPRDFVDVYLKEMKNDKNSENFTKNDLALNMMDFLHAGTETSSTTLKWIVLYLTVYQDVQDR
jgi:cytochrome P450